MLTDTAPFRYPHYHKPSDTPDKVDYLRLARITKGVELVARVHRALMGGELAMRGAIWVLALILLACTQAWADFAEAQEGQPLYLREQLRIPMPEAGSKGLEAVLVRPAAAGKYPLALINHGSPRSFDDRAAMTPFASLPQIALEYARRGFAARS